jgi:2-iminoacetate synthase ThiH
MAEFIKDIHYYLDGDRVIFTEKWLIQREECCGNGCRHCPFDPKHERENTKINEEFLTKEN